MKRRWNLIDAREAMGMDQRALSRLIKMSFATTCNIEVGVRGPNEEVQKLLEEYFSIPREKLFELFERELPEPTMKNRYEIRGDITAIFIDKPDGKTIETIIETKDLKKVMSLPTKWVSSFDKYTNSYYVKGKTEQYRENGKVRGKNFILHRYVLGVIDSKIRVDHINHDTLDNRSGNLRTASGSENAQNKKGANSNSSTRIRNVYPIKRMNKTVYRVALTLNYRRVHIGYFDDLKEAEKAAIIARTKYMPYSQEALAN